VQSGKPRGIGGQTPLPEQLPHDVKSQLVDQFESEDTILRLRAQVFAGLCRIVPCRIVPCGIVWDCAGLCGVVRDCAGLYGILWDCVALCGIVSKCGI